MASDKDFGQFSLTIAAKPVGPSKVTPGEIPETLSTFLAENVKTALDNDSQEIVLTAETENQAKLLSSYAAAWGHNQDPVLRITKTPNGKRYPDNFQAWPPG
jgi:hypothetical protein